MGLEPQTFWFSSSSQPWNLGICNHWNCYLVTLPRATFHTVGAHWLNLSPALLGPFWLQCYKQGLIWFKFSHFVLFQLGLIPPSESEQRRIVRIHGEFVKGKLNGIVNVILVDSTTIEGFAVDNVFHGLVRRFVKSTLKNGRRKRYNSEALNQKAKRDQSGGLTGAGETDQHPWHKWLTQP